MIPEPCEKCGKNRWKTKKKHLGDFYASEYECRFCGYIRKQTKVEKEVGTK